MTDHGNVFGAYDFYKQATAAGVKPIIGMEGYYTPGSRFDRAPFDFGDNLIDEEGDGGVQPGQGRLHPHDAAGPDDGGHAQPLPHLLAGQPRGAVPQAALRPRPARALRQGPHRHDRLPVGRGQHVAARRQGGPRPAGGGGLPGHLRQGELLRRGHGPRAVDREEDQAGAAGDRQGPRHPAAGHQRPALHAQGGRAGPRRAPVHPDRLAAQRDQPLPVQRRRLLPEELRGDARAVRRACPRPATTPCWSPSSAR